MIVNPLLDMSAKKSEKEKLLSKTVVFGGKELKMYSLDGNTWSSRKDELQLIKERFENARLSLSMDASSQIKKGPMGRKKAVAAVATPDAEFVDDIVDDGVVAFAGVEEIAEDIFVDADIADDVDADIIPKEGKALKGAAGKKAKAADVNKKIKSAPSSKSNKAASKPAKAKNVSKPAKGPAKGSAKKTKKK